jgi:o-succinylbenzoate synthase
MQAEITPHILKFITPARTSRGAYSQKYSWLLTLSENGFTGIGEASPLPDLSLDMQADRCNEGENLGDIFNRIYSLDSFEHEITKYPSLSFAYECALLDLKMKNNGIIFENSFTKKQYGIPINGLVWMNNTDSMLLEAEKKIAEGFQCIKFKVGALDHDAECKMLEAIRKKYSAFKIELRLDANGAFTKEDVLEKIKDLARFEIHSLEQPIKAGQTDPMAEICSKSKIPIALDEELIYVLFAEENFYKLLQNINPKFIVLKPTLLGGFRICNEWINAANKLRIGWWATSALEGNIALNHIAQWVSTKSNTLYQGLGTGLLFENNFKAGTEIRDGKLWFLDNK